MSLTLMIDSEDDEDDVEGFHGSILLVGTMLVCLRSESSVSKQVEGTVSKGGIRGEACQNEAVRYRANQNRV